MTGFSRAWLALREPFDASSRDAELGQVFAAALPGTPLIVDLGAGAGANTRFLARIVGSSARFRLVDNDPDLLAVAITVLGTATGIERMQTDLARNLETALAGADAVSAAALMDLVSAPWFDGLAEHAARRRLPLLFTLSVDGRCIFLPADESDQVVLAAFARDQARNKGFGPALGPLAPAYMHQRLIDLGAEVRMAESNWRIDAQAPEMLHALIDGIAEAASLNAAQDAPDIATWRERRRGQIGGGKLSLMVGHQDLLAIW